MTDQLFINDGYWWPKYENKPAASLQFIRKRLGDLDASIKHCKQRRMVIQAGGNIGLWPIKLAESGFAMVYTFEADPITHDALLRNVGAYQNIISFNAALSNRQGALHIKRGPNPGRTRIDATGAIQVPAIAIDDLNIEDCDLIVLDIEGHEPQALAGARKTIQRCRPVIHCEVMGDGGPGVRAFMKGFGYVAKEIAHLDIVYLPK